MILFTHRDHQRLVAGEFELTFRLWKSPHVKAGKTYNSGFGGSYVIEDVRLVRAGDIPESDLRLAEAPDIDSLLELVGRHTHAHPTRDTMLYRVALHYSPETIPEKAALPLATIAARLQRLDETSPRGAWTEATLRLIEEQPETLARILAEQLDWPAPDFKLHVRKLKALGLTQSHPVGYELTPLGQEYLDSLG